MNPAIGILVLLLAIILMGLRSKSFAPLEPARVNPFMRHEPLSLPSIPGWHAGNVNCFEHKKTKYLLVRYINYVLYENLKRKQDGPGNTLCVLVNQSTKEHWPLTVEGLAERPGAISYGIEDARAFVTPAGECFVMGATVGYGPDRQKAYAIMGSLNFEEKKIGRLVLMDSPNSSQQKNWILAHPGKLVAIHAWNPIRMFDIDSQGKNVNNATVPSRTSAPVELRGSSNLLELPPGHLFGKYIALVHTTRVRYGQKSYAHMFVALDASLALVKVGTPFSFRGKNVEFCTGIEWVAPDQVGAYYTVLDTNPAKATIALAKLFD